MKGVGGVSHGRVSYRISVMTHMHTRLDGGLGGWCGGGRQDHKFLIQLKSGNTTLN